MFIAIPDKMEDPNELLVHCINPLRRDAPFTYRKPGLALFVIFQDIEAAAISWNIIHNYKVFRF